MFMFFQCDVCRMMNACFTLYHTQQINWCQLCPLRFHFNTVREFYMVLNQISELPTLYCNRYTKMTIEFHQKESSPKGLIKGSKLFSNQTLEGIFNFQWLFYK